MEFKGKIRLYSKEDVLLPDWCKKDFYLTIYFIITATSLMLCYTGLIEFCVAVVFSCILTIIVILVHNKISKYAGSIIDRHTRDCIFKIDEYDLKCTVSCDDGERYIVFLRQVLIRSETDSKYDNLMQVTRISNDEFPIVQRDGIKSRVCCLLIHGTEFVDLLRKKGIFISGMDI